VSTPLATADRALYAERCRVVDLEEKLAASEARAEKAISDTVQEFGLRRAAEARVGALEEGIRAAMDYSGNRWSEWGERAENVADMLDALLAPPPEAEKKEVPRG